MQHQIRRQIPFLVLVFLPALVMAILVFKYSVNFPFSDQWELASMFERIYEGNLSFNDLFAQFHESRKFFPRLLFIGLAYLTGWDVRAEMWVIFLLTCVVAVNIYLLSCQTLKVSLRQRLLIFFLANLLIFSPSQYENWLWGIQVVVYIPIAGITTCLVVAGSRLSEKAKFWICCSLCTISTFSYANGILSWLIVFPVLVVMRSRQLPEIFQQKRLILGGLIGFGLNAAVYFYNYQKPSDHPSFIQALFRPIDTLHYFLSFLGAPLAFGNLIVATIVGFVVISLWLLVNSYFFGLIKRDFSFWHRLIAWVAIAFYAIISGLATSFGRIGFGVYQSLAPRYTAFSISLMVSLVYLTVIFLEVQNLSLRGGDISNNLNQKPSKEPKQSLFHTPKLFKMKITAYFLVGVMAVLHLNVFNEAVARMRDRREILLQSKACLLTINVIPENDCLVTKQKPETFRRIANILNQLGFLQPGLLKTNDIRDIAVFKSHKFYGYFDTIEPVGDENYLVRGWATLPHRKESADGIILTYKNADGGEIIFKLINQKFPRPEVADYLQNSAYLYSGWQKTFSLSDLPPGKVKLNAWAFDTDTGKAFPLENTQTIENNYSVSLLKEVHQRSP